MKADNAVEWFKEHGELLEFKHKDAKGNDTSIVLTFVTHAAADRYAREFAAEQLRLFAANWRPVPGMTSYQVAEALEARAAELKG